MGYYKKIFTTVVLVITAIAISYSVEAYTSMTKINDKVIRLHVLANSNSIYDQQLKYKIRNKVINNFNNEFEYIKSKNESENVIVKEIDSIRKQAEDIIQEEGYSYEVNVYYGNFKFPRKIYDDIVLPEGYYDAVRIEIGKAEGNNWWCVMFPPLCFVDFGQDKNAEPIFDIQTERKLQEILTKEEIEAIKTKRGIENIKLKSRLFEFIEKGKIDKKQSIYAKSLGDGPF